MQPRAKPIHVNYRLLQENGHWKIYDVTVDAISIIANYRNQFNRVMNNKGYDNLISDLKSKQAGASRQESRQPITGMDSLWLGQRKCFYRRIRAATSPWRRQL